MLLEVSDTDAVTDATFDLLPADCELRRVPIEDDGLDVRMVRYTSEEEAAVAAAGRRSESEADDQTFRHSSIKSRASLAFARGRASLLGSSALGARNVVSAWGAEGGDKGPSPTTMRLSGADAGRAGGSLNPTKLLRVSSMRLPRRTASPEALRGSNRPTFGSSMGRRLSSIPSPGAGATPRASPTTPRTSPTPVTSPTDAPAAPPSPSPQRRLWSAGIEHLSGLFASSPRVRPFGLASTLRSVAGSKGG